jgi:hypothetical protein
MKMNDIVNKAKGLGIKVKGVGNRKGDLIRQIQKAEGNFDCFGTATGYCDQWLCCFREDCLPPSKSKKR